MRELLIALMIAVSSAYGTGTDTNVNSDSSCVSCGTVRPTPTPVTEICRYGLTYPVTVVCEPIEGE